jgi:hypothetical protein
MVLEKPTYSAVSAMQRPCVSRWRDKSHTSKTGGKNGINHRGVSDTVELIKIRRTDTTLDQSQRPKTGTDLINEGPVE